MSAAWAKKFGVTENTFEFFSCVLAMYYQYECVLDEIATSNAGERAKGLFTNAAHSLHQFVHPVLVSNHNVGQLAAQKGSIDTLFLAADAIDDRLLPDLNQLTLDELTKDVSALKEEIAEMDIDERLRCILIDQIDLILVAINSFETLGPEGAAKVYGGAVAELARVAQQEVQQPKDKRAVSKAIDAAKKVGAVVVWAAAVSSGATGLIEDGSALLGLSTTVDKADGE